MLKTVESSHSEKEENSKQSQFSRRWGDIEKKQKRNKTFQKKLATLFSTFQQDVVPEEQKMCQLLAQETQQLIDFMPRKSFTQWQREELKDWIENNLDTLCHHPFGDNKLGYDLREIYNTALIASTKKLDENVTFSDEELDEMRALIQQVFKGKKEFSDEKLADFIRNPALFEQEFKAFIDSGDFFEEDDDTEEDDSEYDEFDQEDEADDDFFKQFDQRFSGNGGFEEQAKADKNKQLKALFDASELNKLYKMLANRLHPDKEKNEHLKVKKSELMAQLAQAKKSKDAFVIISMFQEHFPNHELSLNDDLDMALSALLKEKLAELDSEYHRLKTSDGIPSMIWAKLGGRSKKAIAENMAQHLQAVEESKNEILYTIENIKTVKVLKERLSDRYEQRAVSPFTSLSELFGGDMPFDTPF